MDNDLAVTSPGSLAVQTQHETSIASASARVHAETAAAITIAQKFRRSESRARQELIDAVKASPRLAEKATYTYPRGKRKDPVTGEWVDNIISGPSTYIAREAARIWGNVCYGTEVVRDSDKERQIRSFAWDLQTNMKCLAEATFSKLIQRSNWVNKNGQRTKVTEWVEPDERDLRELSNKYASIGERNCILKIIPTHMIDEVLEVARTTTSEDAAKHPEATRAKLADAYMGIGVNVGMLEEYLGHPLKETTPTETATLRAMFTSIRDGDSKWEDYRKVSLPSDDEVPQMSELRVIAKAIGWNEAKLASEVGRNMADIPALLTKMAELRDKASSVLPAVEKPATATTGEVMPRQQTRRTLAAEPGSTAQDY